MLKWETRPPDFINEEGVHWWHDYSRDGFSIWVIKEEDYITRVAIKDGEIVAESQKLDDLGCKLDMLRLVEDF